jgi:hypothetical protein
MEKPASIKRYELASNLTNIINSCGLPPFIILDVLQLITNQMAELSKQQLATEQEAYNKYLAENDKERRVEEDEVQ